MLRKSQNYHQSSFIKWKTAALLVLAAPQSSARSLHVGVKHCWVQAQFLEHQSAVCRAGIAKAQSEAQFTARMWAEAASICQRRDRRPRRAESNESITVVA